MIGRRTGCCSVASSGYALRSVLGTADSLEAGAWTHSPISVPFVACFRGSMRPESMRVWQAAEEMVAEIDGWLKRVQSRSGNAAYHLERAAESVLFNIGEGVGAWQPKVKITAYEIAKKEANEVRAILRRLVLKRVLTSEEIEKPYNLAGAIVGMLTRAIIAVEQRG
jgi:four helix bundle protein